MKRRKWLYSLFTVERSITGRVVYLRASELALPHVSAVRLFQDALLFGYNGKRTELRPVEVQR